MSSCESACVVRVAAVLGFARGLPRLHHAGANGRRVKPVKGHVWMSGQIGHVVDDRAFAAGLPAEVPAMVSLDQHQIRSRRRFGVIVCSSRVCRVPFRHACPCLSLPEPAPPGALSHSRAKSMLGGGRVVISQVWLGAPSVAKGRSSLRPQLLAHNLRVARHNRSTPAGESKSMDSALVMASCQMMSSAHRDFMSTAKSTVRRSARHRCACNSEGSSASGASDGAAIGSPSVATCSDSTSAIFCRVEAPPVVRCNPIKLPIPIAISFRNLTMLLPTTRALIGRTQDRA